MEELLGLPLDQAKQKLEGKAVEVVLTLPPRHPDKSGTMRVVRVNDTGETVILTVSPFHDCADEVTNG